MSEAGIPTPKRRTLIQRGLALVGGALGVGAIGGEVHGRSAAAEPTGRTLQLLGRGRTPARLGKAARAARQHFVSSGELLDARGKETVGSFHTNAFSLETALGSPLPAGSNIALQTFVLPEGTLFGLGGGPAGTDKTCAVLGGTGRYAGAQGTYVERTAAQSDRDTVEFVFTLKA